MLSLRNSWIACCLITLAIGCSKQEATVEVPSIDIGVEQVVFNPDNAPTVAFDVPGMHCKVVCVPKVHKTLQEQPGVVDVQVDLETKRAVVAIDEALFDANGAVEALLAADFADSVLQGEGVLQDERQAPVSPKEDSPTASESLPKDSAKDET